MSTPETYRDRFAESGRQVFESAHAEARLHEQNRVGQEHILFALVQKNAELFTGLLDLRFGITNYRPGKR